MGGVIPSHYVYHMGLITKTLFSTPPNEGNFYLLDSFFYHDHNYQTANEIYVIPWEKGVIFTSKRDPTSAGCVGCLVRRLISTSYHKSAQIARADSIFCPHDILNSDEIARCIEEVSRWEASATKCLFYHLDSCVKNELHVLPAPGCPCSQKLPPVLNESLANQWLTKWPNVILEKQDRHPYLEAFHIKSTRLPNSAPVFLRDPNISLNIGGSPTAADFRDSKLLEMRLIGESIERYSSSYVSVADSLILVENLFGKSQLVPAECVFGGLHRLAPDQFPPLSSSGVAAHKSIADAKVSAALELIERDALITAWRVSDLDNFSPFYEIPTRLIQQIREYEWTENLVCQQSHKLHIRAVKNQLHLPIVLVFTIPQNVNTSPNFGSGIGFNWISVIKKALCELLQGIAAPDYDTLNGFPSTFVERPRFWKAPQQLEVLKKRLRASSNTADTNFTQQHSLSDLDKSFLERIFFAELTPPDVLLAKWHVVRALCMEFEPFAGSYQREKPNIARVNEFLNHFQTPLAQTINKDPFPFP